MPTAPRRAGSVTLRRAWATVLGLRGDSDDPCLLEWTSEVFAALTRDEDSAPRGENVGRALAERGYDDQALAATVTLLARLIPPQRQFQNGTGVSGARLSTMLNTLLAGITTGYVAASQAQEQERRVDGAPAEPPGERELRVSEARFRDLFHARAASLAMGRLDGVLEEVNDSFAATLHTDADDVVGRNLDEFFHIQDAARLKSAYQHLASGRSDRVRTRCRLTSTDGDDIRVLLGASLLRDPEGRATHFVTMLEDTTDLFLLGRQLRHQTLHHPLTGLPNDQYLRAHLETRLADKDLTARLVVAKLNLDGLSTINDSLGRIIGDRYLRVVAERLRAACPRAAVIAHTGADEFAVVTDSDTVPDVAQFAEDIRRALAEPEYLRGHGLALTAGTGIVIAGSRAGTAELLRQADATMHRAKQRGPGHWQLFDPIVDDQQQIRHRLAATMPGALESGALKPHYQSIVDVQSNMRGTRALAVVRASVRWPDTELGTLDHAQCLALASRVGMSTRLESWIGHQACAALDTGAGDHPDTGPALRLDLSATLAQDPDLVGILRGILDAARRDPCSLHIGVPAAVLLKAHNETADLDETVDNLKVLHELGIDVVLTNYEAALGAISLLDSPMVRCVEIDLLSPLLAGTQDNQAIRALVDLIPHIHSTGTAVTVANVQTEQQMRWWCEAGVDHVRTDIA